MYPKGVSRYGSQENTNENLGKTASVEMLQMWLLCMPCYPEEKNHGACNYKI